MSGEKPRDESERILYLGSFHSFLEESLAKEVKAIREKDILSPIIILVGSNLLGLSLRRFLARKIGTLFNVRFLTFLDLASLLSSEKVIGEGRREIPALADKLIIEEFLRNNQSAKVRALEYFSAIAGYDGFRDAVLETIEDLKEAGITSGDLAGLVKKFAGEGSLPYKKFDELSKIYDHYAAFLKKRRLFDRSDELIEATEVAKTLEVPLKRCCDQGIGNGIAFFVYGFYDFSFIQKKLLEDCIRGVYCRAFFPFHREKPMAYRYAEKTLQWFQGIGFKPEEEAARHGSSNHLGTLQERLFTNSSNISSSVALRKGDCSFEILSAPGEIREVREIIRKVMALISEGTRFEDIGILLRNREDYAPLISEIFDSSDIPYFFSRSVPLSQTREGKSLLLFLSLRDSDYYRGDVMRFITLADLNLDGIFGNSWEPSVSEWDVISMKAGIVHGKEEWLKRLRAYIDGLLKVGSAGELGERLARDRERKDAESFLFFMEKFLSAMDSMRVQGRWSELAGHVLNVFKRFVNESETLSIIEEALGDLDAFDVIQETTTIAQYQKFMKEKLSSSFAKKGKFQSGCIAVVDLAAARGIGFKAVIAPGLVERKFPAFIRQDPILVDAERKRMNAILREERLGLKMDRIEEEKLLFDLLVSSASQKLILSYPRIDPDDATERVPSFLLLRASEAVSGEKVDFEKLERLPFFMRSPLSQLFPSENASCIDELECDLKLISDSMKGKTKRDAYFLSRVSPSFSNALLSESSRWGSKKFTPYDGVFNSSEALERLRSGHRVFGSTISASSLETYAACPFQYFCDKVLDLEVLEEPEEIVTIAALDRGSVIHDILFKFSEAAKAEKKLPFRREHFSVYMRILERVSHECFQSMEMSGRTGFEMMWRIERDKILEDLKRLIEIEIENEDCYIPSHFEVRFGMPESEAFEGDISTSQPIDFPIDGKRKVFFKGRIDRIDVSGDARKGRVIDYKSGVSRYAKKAIMEGGEAVQLPIYILAAEEILKKMGEISVESAQYFYVTRKGEFNRKFFTREEWETKLIFLKTIVRTISEGIENGIFFQTGLNDACRYCDYRLLCGTARDVRFSRKSNDAIIKEYLEMKNIP